MAISTAHVTVSHRNAHHEDWDTDSEEEQANRSFQNTDSGDKVVKKKKKGKGKSPERKHENRSSSNTGSDDEISQSSRKGSGNKISQTSSDSDGKASPRSVRQRQISTLHGKSQQRH